MPLHRAVIGKKTWLVIAAIFLTALAAAGAWLWMFAGYKLSRFAPGGLGESFSTRIYSAPFAVKEGDFSPPDLLLKRLAALKYAAAPGAPSFGQYDWEPPALCVNLRGFSAPLLSQAPGPVSLEYGPKGWHFLSGGGPGGIMLEPELAAELSGPNKVRREPAEAADIPPALSSAVIAVEDKRFMLHHGVDFRATAGALWRDLTRPGVWGGSTITQQLAKNIFLNPRRTLSRKLAEAFLAFYLEHRYTKEQILTLYLNEIYLGQDGPVSIAGVKAASEFYFGKKPGDLDLSECALLAGMIRSPYLYNPRRDPRAAVERRNYALGRMLAAGMITADQELAAQAEPLRLAPAPRRASDANAYFVSEVVRRLLDSFDEDEVFRYGLTVYTTLDPELQADAMAAVRRARFQAALAALDPDTGAVLALAGGKDYGTSQFNRATQSLRQPGSAFKPFVYGAALEDGFTPATLLSDERRRYGGLGGEVWEPHNYGGIYFGTVTLRTALAHSLNSATLDLAGRVGPDKIIDFARRMGVTSPLDDSLAVALGDSGVGLLELTAAYSPFDNGGFMVRPELITAVKGPDGRPLYYGTRERSSVTTPALAYLMTSLLESVVKDGTGSNLAKLYGWARPAAGKTGTSSGGRDAWFVGYTPDLLAGVWAGDDSDKPVGLVGAADALPIWADFMRAAEGGRPPEEFRKPEAGLVSAVIDPESGLLAVSGCPQRRTELFIAGTEPVKDCPLHSAGIKGWFKRVLGMK